MANKELTARVKLDVRDAESKLKRLNTLINSLNRSVKTATKVDNGLAKNIEQYDKLAQSQQRLAIQEQRLAFQRQKWEAQQEAAAQRQAQRQAQIEQGINNTSTALSGVSAMMDGIHQENGKWKMDTDALVDAVAAFIPGYGQVVDALSPVISQMLEWTGLSELVNDLLTIVMGLLKTICEPIRKIVNMVTPVPLKLYRIVNKVKDWWEEQKRVAKETERTAGFFDGIWGKVRQIAGALIGVGSIKIAVEGADTLTGAQNRFNNIASNILGDSAYTKNSNGDITGYSKSALKFTSDTMDKIYLAAKGARTSYSDMLSNVSKTMTLASDAFKGNVDNAIRFQEVMAKAYAVSGASAQEMSTSMYQLTQALGSGVLQGDELRSVREGAALAYQAIEKFAQGVYDSTDSLKDMAAEGMITSDLVVAAILNMGSGIDQAFALTKFRFGEVFTQIKSAAERAFQPMVEELTRALNVAVNNGLVEKFEALFINLSKGVMISFKLIEKAVQWIKDNWPIVKDVIVGALIAIGTYFTITGLIATWEALVTAAAWIAVNWPLLVVVGTLALIIWAFYKAGDGGVDACAILVQALKWVSIALLVVGLLTGNVGYMMIGTILMVAACFMNNLSETTGRFAAAVVIMAVRFYNFVAETVNEASGMYAVMSAVFTNIKIAWNNILVGMEYLFWTFIDSVLHQFQGLLPMVNKVLAALDKPTIDVNFAHDRMKGLEEDYGFVNLADAYNNAFKLPTLDENAIGKKTYEIFSSKEGFNEWINGLANDFGDKLKGLSLDKLADKFGVEMAFDLLSGKISGLDALGEKLGLDFSGFDLPDPNDPGKQLNPDSVESLLSDIADSTGNIADDVKISEEDLAYLREVANMEWKKEYTTASIVVDMSNYNTINGENDIDGIVTKLADKLYEEMDYLANGVYA